jgi:hypothetical protein
MKGILPSLRVAAALLLLPAGFTGLSALEDLPLVNTQTISLAGVNDLSLSYGAAEVILKESESGDLVVREYMNRDNPRYYAAISRDAGALRIRRGKRPWLPWLLKIRAEIYLPPSFRENLRILHASGDFRGEADLLGYKTIDISVSSGAVFLNRLSAETVSIRAASGGLSAAGIGGNSYVSVSSGKLDIGELAGTEHRIKVSSGRTRIGALEGAAGIEISSGNLELEKFRGRLALDVSSGSVRVGDFSGEGTFELSSGNLNLDVRELAGDLRFRLSSGDVDLAVPSGLFFHLDAVTRSGMVLVNEGGAEALRVTGNSSVLRPLGAAPESAAGSAEVRTIYARTSSGKVIINRR